MTSTTIHFFSESTQNDAFFRCEIGEEEWKRYTETKKFPIKTSSGMFLFLNDKNELHRDGNLPAWHNSSYYEYRVNGKLHRTNGPARFDTSEMDRGKYYLNGIEYTKKEWGKRVPKKIIFSAQKIKTLKKLLYIPELFQNVFYERKSDFISLIQKI